ncbi:MAG: ABC transporter ATP-binding protein/permease [Clostridia bacterium]|nr:ABC transporter ATP-binding protein/permease [Clostridia bacterium]
MLQTKELVKIYKPKKGVPVTALNKVSVKFPDNGMIFLLGKSGSGKSTLLNLLGGLDSYDSGEIIIKGVSSKDFKQSHFDSYRNTYVGFIFQEYNVLEEFTVGANIALAIQLQGRKATDSEINEILKEVDLEGYGNRKPNELSGGQKQRIAIARALVKKPKIIMADEPTGALDSNTGKAIFDTLKKLSKDKLVLVVSHDRDFAEQYADRIIELADGSVISDMELDGSIEADEGGISFNENTVEVPKGYHLTEKDRKAINDYIDALNSNLDIKIAKKKARTGFVKTDDSKIKDRDGSKFELIKSKLPLKNAFKIGANGLKHKKFRLVMTVLLSCIAFGLFGVSDTFAAYNHIETCTNSLYDSDINYLSIQKAKKADGDNNYRNWGYKLSNEDLNTFKADTGVNVYGIFVPEGEELSINQNIDTSVKLTENLDIYVPRLSGYGTINKQIADELGFDLLAGKYPNGNKDEVAISEYIFEIFKKAKYTDGTIKDTADGNFKVKYTEIKNYSDILGKKINLSGKEFTITAVIDTHLDIERYISLTEENENASNSDKLLDNILFTEFDYARSYSYASVAMLGDGHVEKMVKNSPKVASITEGNIWLSSDKYEVYPSHLARLSDIDDKKIEWVNGKKTKLSDNELIVSVNICGFFDQPQEYQTMNGFDYKAFFKDFGTVNGFAHTYGEEGKEEKFQIVGFIDATEENIEYNWATICSDAFFNKMTDGLDKFYGFAVGSKPQDKQRLKEVVSCCYSEDAPVRYPIQNPITFELDSVNEFLVEFSEIFMYIGLGFALFAGVMLANFISTSISYKKQEIGILRAIGSRSNDVFRIFFSESFIIAMINFVLSAIGVFVVTNLINGVVRNNLGILITVLSFSVRQVVLLLAVSILVAFLASFFPVKKIASKKPIDAIRDR